MNLFKLMLFFFIAFCSPSLFSEILQFKSGGVIIGEIIELTDKTCTIKAKQGYTTKVYMENVVRIGSYKGELKKGYPFGVSKMTFRDGSFYIGEWKGWMFHGEGKLVHSDGSFYDGEWKKSNRHGKGKQTWTSHIKYKSYDGSWVNDFFHNKGNLIKKDSSIFKGNFKYGHAIGYGIKTLKDGKVEKGSWIGNNIVSKKKVKIRERNYKKKYSPFDSLLITKGKHSLKVNGEKIRTSNKGNQIYLPIGMNFIEFEVPKVVQNKVLKINVEPNKKYTISVTRKHFKDNYLGLPTYYMELNISPELKILDKLTVFKNQLTTLEILNHKGFPIENLYNFRKDS